MQILSLAIIQVIATLLQQYSYLQKRKLEHGIGCNANPRVVNMFLMFGLFCEFCMLMFLPICLFVLINTFQILGFFVYAVREQKSRYKIETKQILGVICILSTVLIGYLCYGSSTQWINESNGLSYENYMVMYFLLVIQLVILIITKVLNIQKFTLKVAISSSFLIQTLSNLKILAISLKLALQQRPQVFTPVEIICALLVFMLLFQFQANLTFRARKNQEASVFMIFWVLIAQFISLAIISPFIFNEQSEMEILQYGTLIAGFVLSCIGSILLVYNEVSSFFSAQEGLNYYKELKQ